VWIAWPRSSDDTIRADGASTTVPRRAVVLEHATSRHLLISQQPDEIVRLVDGSLTITVARLAPAERFRLITGDSEVEADGAAFDATAQGDRLISVRAIHSSVRILGAPGAPRIVNAGETWRATTQLAIIEGVPAAPPPSTVPSPVPAPVLPALTPTVTRTPTPPAPTDDPPIDPPIVPIVVELPVIATATTRSMGQQAFEDGWVAMRSGDFAAAAKAFERVTVVTSEPRIVEDATFWRGVALARTGEVGTTSHLFTAFLKSYPTSERAHEVHVMLGWILFERSDVVDARRHFEAGMKAPSARVRQAAAAGLSEVARRSNAR
jgi:hypothetical protein